ncbi:MerR family transcriptional regulator [Sporosarcina sp. Te-1]|uniref:helix-turn-helix domain-containing protein n=1 Tax=Sporosarcina sp. Te-1 TaxID=2818390 RepID=UPI001A9D3D99|nr:MerR family transcriptional regulator [Sporosarcina sp. Te-1]QTD40117.1 MerR family transcriptional regulator [Sporosarcina sp. Te-1]
MKIGEFAAYTGSSKDTIRYYEKMGLLQPNIVNKHREYDAEQIELMSAIRKLKHAGFTLQEIKLLFQWLGHLEPDTQLTEEEIQSLEQVRALFQQKQAYMMQREKEIQQIQQVLLRADRKMELLLEKNRRDS